MLILNSQIKKYLKNSIVSSVIIKRFYPRGDKPMGHARKLLAENTKIRPTYTESSHLYKKAATDIKDKSGRNNHPTNPSWASNPPKAEVASISGKVEKRQNNPTQTSEDFFVKRIQDSNQSVAPLVKSPSILSNKSGKNFSTIIEENTSCDSISDDHLKKELKDREMVKDDPGQLPTKVKVDDGSIIGIVKGKINVKITPLGSAYNKSLQKDNNIPSVKISSEISTNAFRLILPRVENFEPYITEMSQNHILVARPINENHFELLGLLTSKGSAPFFHDTQVIDFQRSRSKDILHFEGIQKKIQNFIMFKERVIIDTKHCSVVAHDLEYLQASGKIPTLKLLAKSLENLPFKSFNYHGITKENCLDMCKLHDRNIKNKKPHPQTDEQIKQTELGKIKQKELQNNKKPNNFNSNDSNENS